jgi:hypothetical protein
MDNDIAQSIEKHMEGTNLGLAALAEVLAKMDERLSEDEEADYDQQLQLEEDEARTELVKEIAGEVFEVLKAEGAGIGNADSKTTNKAEQGNIKGGADSDDSSKTVTPDTSLATAGRPTESPTGSSLDHDSPGGSQLNTTSQKAWEGDEKDDERRKSKKEEDEDEQIRDLRLELEDLKASINDQVSDGVAARLNKSGFKEANTLKAPRMIDLGADAAPLSKDVSTEEDLLDILVKMDDKEVRRLESKVMGGDYDGVPIEILKSFGITG